MDFAVLRRHEGEGQRACRPNSIGWASTGGAREVGRTLGSGIRSPEQRYARRRFGSSVGCRTRRAAAVRQPGLRQPLCDPLPNPSDEDDGEARRQDRRAGSYAGPRRHDPSASIKARQIARRSMKAGPHVRPSQKRQMPTLVSPPIRTFTGQATGILVQDHGDDHFASFASARVLGRRAFSVCDSVRFRSAACAWRRRLRNLGQDGQLG